MCYFDLESCVWFFNLLVIYEDEKWFNFYLEDMERILREIEIY